MSRGTGQRVQVLTFRGSFYLNTRNEFHFNTVATQAGSVRQEVSGNTEADAATPRDPNDPTSNGHFEMIPT